MKSLVHPLRKFEERVYDFFSVLPLGVVWSVIYTHTFHESYMVCKEFNIAGASADFVRLYDNPFS